MRRDPRGTRHLWPMFQSAAHGCRGDPNPPSREVTLLRASGRHGPGVLPRGLLTLSTPTHCFKSPRAIRFPALWIALTVTEVALTSLFFRFSSPAVSFPPTIGLDVQDRGTGVGTPGAPGQRERPRLRRKKAQGLQQCPKLTPGTERPRAQKVL